VNAPLVSVVAIFLNGERFLREAIESVISQTYDHWELFLVDDGSTDGSTAIAREYVQRFPDRVHYLDHPEHRNLGMSTSRNLGIQHSVGDYTALLDADDVWLPEKLAEQVAILESKPDVNAVFGRPMYWFGWTGLPEDLARDFVLDPKVETERVYEPPSLVVPFLRRVAHTPCPSDIMVRRQAVRAIGGFEPLFTGMCEDLVFFAKLFLAAPAFASARTWIRYRQHPDSTYAISKRSPGHALTRLNYLAWFRDYLEARALDRGAIWDALREELRPFEGNGPAANTTSPPSAFTSILDRVSRLFQRRSR
jgi:glycosyltransferase involved in cell wall biosynthesis